MLCCNKLRRTFAANHSKSVDTLTQAITQAVCGYMETSLKEIIKCLAGRVHQGSMLWSRGLVGIVP